MTRIKGITLLELMVTLAIVSILASVAIPTYQSYMQRGNRSEAISALQSVMQAQERFYADAVSYTVDLSDLGFATATFDTDNGLYTISARQCEDGAGNAVAITQCVELEATALGTQDSDGDLVLNSYGAQSRILPDASVADW